MSDEQRAFYQGFLCGAAAYAAKMGHSQLKSENPDLVECFQKGVEAALRYGMEPPEAAQAGPIRPTEES
jgi:hypothetical protein